MITEWYMYVVQFDNMLAEACMICARNSMNNVYHALCSEGDINPAPLIIINADIEDKKISLTPDIQVIESIMENMCNRIISSLNSIPRIAERLGLPAEHIGPTFSELMKSDTTISEIQEKICAEVEFNKEEMDVYVSDWDNLSEIWEMSEDEFIKRIEITEQTADVYEDSIETFSANAEVVSMKDPIATVYFLMINQTALKNSLLDYIEQWQLLNIKLLTKRSSSRVKSKQK